jgi:acylphosphatase
VAPPETPTLSDDRTSALRRVEVVVRGRVQGVGYRIFASRAAERHGIVGWVSNQSGGTVRALGEGDKGDLEAWLGELRRGPAGGFVSDVDERWSDAAGGLDDFEIRSGWHPGD